MIDLTFRNINKLFFLSFKNGDNGPTINSSTKYYMPLVEIKDFNVLISNKPFVDQPVKSKQEVYEKRVEISRNDDFTTESLLDYLYHQKYYKLAEARLIPWKSRNRRNPRKLIIVFSLIK